MTPSQLAVYVERMQNRTHYEITSYGWRLPLFSTYPNITEVEDLGRADGCEV